MSRRRPRGLSSMRSDAIPVACASPLPTDRPMARPSIPRSPQRRGRWRACSRGLGHHVEERAPVLAADPAAVMATIVGANTALSVRQAEQRFGRAMTDSDFEILTLASAHNAQKTTATDYVAAQLNAFRISRALADFFETCDVFLCPTLCSPPLRIGELNPMSQDLSHIAPILRRYMPATAMFNMSGQPAMSVPLAWNAGRIAARHDVLRRASATRRRCCAWRPSSSRSGPGRANCRRFAPKSTKLSLIRERGMDSRRQRSQFVAG